MIQILLADDKEVFRRKFKRLPCIRDSGRFRIASEAENGLEVIDYLRKNPGIDIVITDIRMPIKDGLEVLRDIREQNLCRCVILLSEYSDFEYAKEGIVYGAFDYIVKPADNEKIEKVLRRAEEFLEGGQHENYYTRHDVRTVAKLLLQNDDYALDYAEKQFRQLITKHREQASARKIIGSFFEDLRREILKADPALEAFVSFRSLPVRMEEEGGLAGIREELGRLLGQIRECHPDTGNPLIRKLCAGVLVNIEGDTSLKRMASEYYMNKEYLSHLFRTETGKTYTEYITGVKMMYAKKRLDEPGIRVYDIADALGFKDTEYFSKVYKKYYGSSPSEHKKNK